MLKKYFLYRKQLKCLCAVIIMQLFADVLMLPPRNEERELTLAVLSLVYPCLRQMTRQAAPSPVLLPRPSQRRLRHRRKTALKKGRYCTNVATNCKQQIHELTE